MSVKDIAGQKKILTDFLKANGLRVTRQRLVLLDLFLKTHGHMSPREIYAAARKHHPRYGWATVYRTLKLFSRANLASPINFDSRTARYEPETAGKHHDHLVCTVCGKSIEFYDDKIEALQEAAAAKRGFIPKCHSLEIYGVCSKCLRRVK
ncbi:MAG: transcriptional repressor [Elusimicrobia bacterium HGW-Elusimicrobia-1]|jgi:Fur family ferric uptake transcriptional regulator|nr:MAG: transcriptional repressor [Elusimicrobia bacterium HGW-Elusimicrobia-1]